MNFIKLGVNIDHVATIRNARGESYPDPLEAALVAQKSGADSITVHLREDRRHIRDYDLKKIKDNLVIPLNLEIAATNEMLNIAIKYKPNFVCIVPEKRRELTTEGGLNLNKKNLKRAISKLKKNKISVTLFINPKIIDVNLAKKLGASSVEFHTGKFCELVNNDINVNKEYYKIKNAAILGKKLGLNVHAGHGLTYKSAKKLSKIKQISEYNIGHFIISEALFVGLKKSIKKFKKILK